MEAAEVTSRASKAMFEWVERCDMEDRVCEVPNTCMSGREANASVAIEEPKE